MHHSLKNQETLKAFLRFEASLQKARKKLSEEIWQMASLLLLSMSSF